MIWLYLTVPVAIGVILCGVIWVIDSAEAGSSCPWGWCEKLKGWLAR